MFTSFKFSTTSSTSILLSYWIASSIPSIKCSSFSQTFIPTLEPVVAGLTTNVIARQDNAPVVNSITESTTTEVRHTEVVNNDYIAAQFATEQFMNMVSSLDNKDYNTYDKLSYDYAYGTNIYDELVSSGHGLEDFIRK